MPKDTTLKNCLIITLLLACMLAACTTLLHRDRVLVKEGIEMDTAIVKDYLSALNAVLIKDPADSSVAHQAVLVKKYLLACAYYEGGGWSWATKSTGLSFTKRLFAAKAMLEEITVNPANPLYDRSLYLLARIYYWLDLEDDGLYADTVSKRYFKQLAIKYPSHNVLKMYLGEKIITPLSAHADVEGAPQWAVYQREAMDRMLQIIYWWVNEKQAANGEMGGKYGDDVEILRWWLPAILGADDSIAALGYSRLADGVWNSDALDRGFAKRIDDVEHSAELFRDTHPGMLLIKYGDPEYIERCMISMQHFKNEWTGITPMGHRHFKSYFLSSTGVSEGKPNGVDVPLNARAVLPGLWVAWYNHHPAIIKPFEEWCHAWMEDAGRTENGKPAGVLPAAVTFETDKIGGFTGSWYDANLAYTYYRWESLGHVSELYTHLAGMYAIIGNTDYLAPFNAAVQMIRAAKMPGPYVNVPGTSDWVKNKLLGDSAEVSVWGHPFAKVLSMTKQLTGKVDYDSLVMAYGKPYNRYRISGNKNEIITGLKGLVEELKYNFPLFTSEVKFTDRVYVHGSNLLMGMYTGHFGGGYEYPSMVADWKNTGKDVSVFVRNGTPETACISLFNFGAAKQVTMRTWQLVPGTYRLRTGYDINDDGIIDTLITEENVTIHERVNSLPVTIPSKRAIVVLLNQVKASVTGDAHLPDPAIASRDISISDTVISAGGLSEITAYIHNIGTEPAQPVKAFLSIDGKIAGEAMVPSIESPYDLVPRKEKVVFSWKAVPGVHKVEVKILPVQEEITTVNNDAVIWITLNSGGK